MYMYICIYYIGYIYFRSFIEQHMRKTFLVLQNVEHFFSLHTDDGF